MARENDVASSPADALRRLDAIAIADGVVSVADAERAYRAVGTADMSDGTRTQLVRGVFGKLIGHRNSDQLMRVVPHFVDLMRAAVPAYSEPQRDPQKHRNIIAYHNYVAKARMDNRDYYVRFTVQEVKKEGGREFHNTALSDVEMTEAAIADIHSRIIDLAKIGGSGLGKRLVQWLADVKQPAFKCLFFKAQRRDAGGTKDMFGDPEPATAPAAKVEREVQHKGYTDSKGHYHAPHQQRHEVLTEAPKPQPDAAKQTIKTDPNGPSAPSKPRTAYDITDAELVEIKDKARALDDVVHSMDQLVGHPHCWLYRIRGNRKPWERGWPARRLLVRRLASSPA